MLTSTQTVHYNTLTELLKSDRHLTSHLKLRFNNKLRREAGSKVIDSSHSQ